MLQDKLVKRKVSLRFTEPGKPEPTAKGGARIVMKIKEGIEVDKARSIVQAVKDAKLKVQASIQESQVRVNGKNKDDLQAAIQSLRGARFRHRAAVREPARLGNHFWVRVCFDAIQ